MTTFANCVSIFLIAIGAIAVIAGITNAAESGANSALTGVTAMFSGLLLIAAALGLRLLAIIARELGVPTVVQIDGLTSAIRTGMTVSVDGASGRITLLEDQPDQARSHA